MTKLQKRLPWRLGLLSFISILASFIMGWICFNLLGLGMSFGLDVLFPSFVSTAPPPMADLRRGPPDGSFDVKPMTWGTINPQREMFQLYGLLGMVVLSIGIASIMLWFLYHNLLKRYGRNYDNVVGLWHGTIPFLAAFFFYWLVQIARFDISYILDLTPLFHFISIFVLYAAIFFTFQWVGHAQETRRKRSISLSISSMAIIAGVSLVTGMIYYDHEVRQDMVLAERTKSRVERIIASIDDARQRAGRMLTKSDLQVLVETSSFPDMFIGYKGAEHCEMKRCAPSSPDQPIIVRDSGKCDGFGVGCRKLILLYDTLGNFVRAEFGINLYNCFLDPQIEKDWTCRRM